MNPLSPVGDIGANADLDVRALANSMAAGVWVVDSRGSLIGGRVPVALDGLISRAVSRLPDSAAARVHVAAFAVTTIQCDEPRVSGAT